MMELTDFSNFTVSFSALGTLSSTVVSLENIQARLRKLNPSCAIRELRYDNAMNRFHVLVRVSNSQEEPAQMSFDKEKNSFRIEPIANIRLCDLIVHLGRLISELNLLSSESNITHVRLATWHNQLTATLLSKDLGDASLSKSEVQSVVDIKPTVSRPIDVSPLLERKFMIIDGNSLLHRAYYATSYKKAESELATDVNGHYIGACKAFMELLGKYMKKYLPTHLAVAWDNPDEALPTFRHKLYPNYKGQRDEKPTAYIEQRKGLFQMLNEMNIYQVIDESGDFEADDLIGTLTKSWRQMDSGEIYMISNDKDLFQLLDEHTIQLLKINKEDVVYTFENFKEDYGIHPLSFIDCKAIMGDSSDSYTGISGVGKKAVFPLLQKYQTLENLLDHLDDLKLTPYKRYIPKFEEGKEDGLLCKRLATIVRDVPISSFTHIDDLKLNINRENKMRIFKSLGFY